MSVLFLFSHPDDEAFGPAGTIARASLHSSVCVVSLCKGDRPGNEEVAINRLQAFKDSCASLGATGVMFNSSDLHLDYHTALTDIEFVLSRYNPSIVFTHNISDVHRDHRITAKAALAACRPKLGSAINELYMCEIPASTYWSFGEIEPVFTPNTYKDVTEFMDKKRAAMELYTTEVYKSPDARSIESMESLARYRGSQVNYQYAEAFKLVFSRD